MIANPMLRASLFKRRASGFSATTLDWANRVVTNGGVYPSNATLTAVDAWHLGNVSDGTDVLIRSATFFAPDNLIAAITPFYTVSGADPWTNTNLVSGDLSVNGLSFSNGKVLDTGVIPATAFFNDNSAGLIVYRMDAYNAINETDMGGTDAPFTSPFILIASQNGVAFYECYGITAGTYATANNPSYKGWLSGQRTASNALALYIANSGTSHTTLATATGAPASRPNFRVYCGAYNDGGTPANTAGSRLSFSAVTLGLTNTQDANLFARTQTLRQAFGGGFV